MSKEFGFKSSKSVKKEDRFPAGSSSGMHVNNRSLEMACRGMQDVNCHCLTLTCGSSHFNLFCDLDQLRSLYDMLGDYFQQFKSGHPGNDWIASSWIGAEVRQITGDHDCIGRIGTVVETFWDEEDALCCLMEFGASPDWWCPAIDLEITSKPSENATS